MATIGNYRIIKQIGEGGFARTYLAEHVILGEKACLKQNISCNASDTKALLHEAKLLWQIHHHSLPTLRDIIKVPGDDSYALVMTFIEGKDLFKIITEHYPKGLEPEHVCWIMQRLLNALHYLHHHGIVHCDVKPQNIIIQANDHNAVLVDYGISSLRPGKQSKATGMTEIFGAPELELGLPPVPETDLYGLGLSMLFALGGDPSAKSYPRGNTVPQELKDFIARLIRHDVKERPKSAVELIEPLSKLREKLFKRTRSGLELKLDNV